MQRLAFMVSMSFSAYCQKISCQPYLLVNMQFPMCTSLTPTHYSTIDIDGQIEYAETMPEWRLPQKVTACVNWYTPLTVCVYGESFPPDSSFEA